MDRGLDIVTLKAAYVIPSPEELIEGGRVVVQGTKIMDVGPLNACNASGMEIDLGTAAIIPGLINAHTHLELTDLEGKIPPPKSFAHWLKQMVAFRMEDPNRDLSHAIERGVQLSLKAGTTTVADIANTNDSFKVLPRLPIRKRVFKELITLNPMVVASVLEEAIRILSEFPRDGLSYAGLSPHAPYTACDKLYKGSALFTKGQDILLTTHISESEEELEFLSKGTGSLAIMLRAYGFLDNWKPPGLSPIAFLEKIGATASPWLLAHCNYVHDEEIHIIKESGSSVVYCPGSHHYFGHKRHPFPRLLSEGINVALGTDSLASTKSLSILDEMRFVIANYKEISPQDVLGMATVRGAKALGLEGCIGRLSPGLEADLAVIELPEDGGGHVLDRLFQPEAQNVFTMVAGRPCYDRHSLLVDRNKTRA
ncbi:MAG: amidohydrolase family protein [Candidatus Brocadiales bacterium]